MSDNKKLSPIEIYRKSRFEESNKKTRFQELMGDYDDETEGDLIVDNKELLSEENVNNALVDDLKDISKVNIDAIDEIATDEEPPKKNEDVYSSSLLKTTSNMNLYRIDIDKLVDAPRDWNFFPPLDEAKFEELINSIQINGLLVPLVVWDQGNGKYMILSGHNRKRAYEVLYERTNNDKKYKSIFCMIKNENEIDIEDAKTIIIDTNFVQRELSTSIKSKCIMEKYRSLNRILGRKKYASKEKSISEIISEEYNIKKTQLFLYYKLGKLIPQIMAMLDSNKLSLKAGGILADLPQDFQLKLYNNYRSFLDNKRIMKIDKNATEEEIIAQLTYEEEHLQDYISVTNTIPKDKYDEFISYVDEWLKKNA